MILGHWKKIELLCMNHEEPLPLTVREGTSKFYACPKYRKQDDAHENGYTEFERPCLNRVHFSDAEGIVTTFSSVVEESLLSGEMADFTNYSFRYKNYRVEVLAYSATQHITLGIVNERALGAQQTR